jgi:hypothetical protein
MGNTLASPRLGRAESRVWTPEQRDIEAATAPPKRKSLTDIFQDMITPQTARREPKLVTPNSF